MSVPLESFAYVGTFLGGVGTLIGLRNGRRSRRLESTVGYGRLAKALEDGDQLRAELRTLRASNRRLGRECAALRDQCEKLRAALARCLNHRAVG